jgi:Tol biopolymer transport system component
MRHLIASLAVLVAASALPDAALGAPGGRLLFDNSRIGANCGESCEETGPHPSSIFSMRANGTGFRRLAVPCAGARCSWPQPAPSPNGRTIALPGLWLVNANGANLRRVPGVEDDASDAAWSPGGRRLAFSCFWRLQGGASQSDVCTVAPDGSGFRRLTMTGGGEPTWSPNGQIAFVRPVVYQGRPRLWTMAADGGGPARRLTDGWARNPSFSPGGSRIAYECRGAICVVAADGSGRRRLARFGSSPTWSPNGRWIAYIGQNGITRIRPDGSGRTLISPRSYPYANLAWTRVPR